MKDYKKFLGVVCAVFIGLTLTACGGTDNSSGNSPAPDVQTTAENNVKTEKEAQSDESKSTDNQPAEAPAADNISDTVSSEGGKILVAYFSATGTTKQLAEYAADALKCDIYEIIPAEKYSDADLNYNDSKSRSSIEMNDKNSRPEFSGNVSNMEQYDIVFLGYPIWWGEAPRIVDTFMESYDFSGKTIVPFCTSGSSPIGSSAKNLHSLASDTAVWLDGDRLNSGYSRDDMVGWINGLGLDITAE